MDDRKPSVRCSCGHSFEVAPSLVNSDVACPKCGLVVPAHPAAPSRPEGPRTSRMDSTPSGPRTPRTDSTPTGPRTSRMESTPSGARPAAPAKESPSASKSDPPPRTDSTKGGIPGTTRRSAPLKEAPLPEPIPGYTFVKRLGQGGMGEVYLAKQESLDRLVAIKMLPPDLAKDQSYVSGFMKEARSAGKVTHENIMGSIDVGESNGRYYFVMEYVAGETVFRMIRHQKTIPEAQALDIARQVARGLRHALQQGLIHRDIKPHNILITAEGKAKICDFGLATELKSDDAAPGEDEENVHTTPAYASPEQCRAEPLDHRTDIYSLGVTLYEMLTGRRPFVASTPRELMTKHVKDPPQPPRAVNPAVSEAANALVLKMLSKQRDDRPRTYDELVGSLDAALKSPGSPKTRRAPGEEPAEGEPSPLRRKLPLLVAGAAAALVLIVGGIVLATRKPPPPPPDPAAGRLDAEVQRRLDDMRAIQRNALGRPAEYAAVRAKWKALEEQYASTAHRAIFAGARLDFENAVNAEADGTAREAVEEASRLLAEGHTGEAMAALRRFPGEFAGTPASSKIGAKMLEIERARDDKLRTDIEAISALAAAGKLDEARQKLVNFRSVAALEGGELRPQVQAQLDELLHRIDASIAEAKSKTPDAPSRDPQPSLKPADPGPAKADRTPSPAATSRAPLDAPMLPPAAAVHFLVLREPKERAQTDKRLAAAGYFSTGASRSAFHHAAAIFLARDESSWKLDETLSALQEYLNSSELNYAEPSKRGDGLSLEQHQKLLELLIQKIAAASTGSIDALQLFACAHLQEIAARKGKIDPALVIQGRFAKGPISDLWGPASSVARIEIAGLLLKPPGLWVPRVAESSSMAGDFPTRYLGALCTVKDQTFDPVAAMDRWKKLGVGAPDPAAWAKYGDAVAERIKQEMTCEMCLGQGRFTCSACGGTGAMICMTCRGTGKATDPSEGGMVTCKACMGRRVVACTICLGAKSMKCPSCDGKRTHPLLVGTHYRMFIDLGLCEMCGGTGSHFTAVGYPCTACEGTGRTLDGVLRAFAKLPPWSLKSREGRMLFMTLRWLARHQSPDGSWGASTWTTACREAGCKAVPAGVFDLGVTSLALGAFLNAGIGPDSPVEFGGVAAGTVVKKAIAWILAQQAPEGLIAHGSSIKPVFENHVATWALFSAYTLYPPGGDAPAEKDRTALREAATRALRWSLNAQSRGGGWGYTVGATSDTWVTSWGAQALLAAKDAGIEIPRINVAYILQWLDSVTDKKDFHIGYTPTQMAKVNLAGNESFAHHDTLSALGSLMRFLLEGKPSATYAAADKLIDKDLPNPDALRRDYCYWYFGSLYSSVHDRRSGTLWTLWTQPLVREELELQETSDTCTLGSYPVNERWCVMGGKVYASAINALTLGQILGTRPASAPRK